jgi:hypothetical protein
VITSWLAAEAVVAVVRLVGVNRTFSPAVPPVAVAAAAEAD